MPEQIICPHCRTTTPASSNLCYRCGGEIPDYLKEGTIECTHCLQITSAAEETCRHCGKPIPAYLLAYHRYKQGEAAEREGEAAKDKALPPDKAQPAPPQGDVGVAEKEPEPKVEAPAVAAKVRPPRPADTSMKLLIRRNQRSGILRRHIAFTIDVRAELSPEMIALVKKYNMGKEILFYKEKVDLSDFWLLGPFRQIIRVIAARLWNIKITVNDLVKGKHMECKDIREMLDAEEQIREASATFKQILNIAAHFGGEEVVEI